MKYKIALAIFACVAISSSVFASTGSAAQPTDTRASHGHAIIQKHYARFPYPISTRVNNPNMMRGEAHLLDGHHSRDNR